MAIPTAERSPVLRACLLCTIALITTWCAYPPLGLAFLTVVPPAMLLLVALPLAEWTPRKRRWKVYAVVFAIGWAKWMALHFWLVQVTEAGLPALSVYGACFDVLLVWCLVRARRACGPAVPWSALLAVVLAGVESLRSLVLFDGYPWFRAGHPFADWPVLVQTCDLGGEVMATLLVGAISGAAVDVLCSERTRRSGFATAACALTATIGYGAFRLSEAPQGIGPGVLAIQTNVSTSNKIAWTPQQQVIDVRVAADLTLEGAHRETQAGHSVSLVAWPETMLGGYGLEPQILQSMEAGGYVLGRKFQELVANLSDVTGAPLLVGSPVFMGMRQDGKTWVWDRQFNSAYLVTGHRLPYPRYDKLFLAPFGETMPYIRAFPELQKSLLAVGAQGMTFDLSAGDKPVQFRVPWRHPDGYVQTIHVATPICFEDAMGWVCRDLVFPSSPKGRERKADLLVNISNDGWFGWYDGGREQHVQLAKFRCIETRTPMVRVANSGVCIGLDSSGRVTNEPLPARTTGSLYCNPPLDTRTPLYALIGDAVSWLVMLGTAILAMIATTRGRKSATGPGGIAHAGNVAAALAALCCSVALPGCADQPPSTVNQPAWSSRTQSITPTGKAQLSESGVTGGAPLPVTSSGSTTQTAALLLQQATRSPVPVFRANATEALINSPDDLRPVARAMLADGNRGVRFVAAMAVGRAGLTDMIDALQPLLVDESPSVRAAAMCSLTRLGVKVDLTPLAGMTRSDDPEIRSNAYLVLGEIGNPSALPLIKDSLGRGLRRANPARVKVVELQAAETMVRLGDFDQLEPIRAALFAPTGDPGDQSEIIALAAQIAGRLKDEGSRPMLVRLISATSANPPARPAEIRVTAAASLAELGTQDHKIIAQMARDFLRERDAIVRGQAALALARAEGPQALPDLEKLMFDTDASVQLAAAKAVLIATRRR